MNPSEAISKIKNLLGFDEIVDTKTEEKFATTVLNDNETQITNNMDDDFKIGQVVYVVSEEGELIPASEGKHITREGFYVILDPESKIIEIGDETDEPTEREETPVAEEDENLSEKEEEMSEEVKETMSSEEMMNEIELLKAQYAELSELVSNFVELSKEEFSNLNKNVEEIKKSPAAEPVVKKNNVGQSFADWRYEQLTKFIK